MFSALEKVKILLCVCVCVCVSRVIDNRGEEMHATVSSELMIQSGLLEYFHQAHKPTDYLIIHAF